jgi:hypothetical protein
MPEDMNEILRLKTNTRPLVEQLVEHPIYGSMTELNHLHVFMENHVFAVWDFMTLLKALQRRLTCIDEIWLPADDSQACRLINEIVLCEESDEDGKGGFASHFELYRRAMKDVGAETRWIDQFLAELRDGKSVLQTLEDLPLAGCTRSFVYRTISMVTQGQTCELAAMFAFGREQLLPEVFERVLSETQAKDRQPLNSFLDYLQRHIEVDGDSHGPMAEEVLTRLCGDDRLKWQLAEEAAVRSLQSRLELWDGVMEEIERCDAADEESSAPTAPVVRDHDLERAIQFGWINGLTTREIGRQLQMPQRQVESILRDVDRAEIQSVDS